MTLKTTANLQEFLFEFACGNSIKKALATIGGTSEQTIGNWLRESRNSGPGAWIVSWPPDGTGKPTKFHVAYDDARRLSMALRQSELRDDLEARYAWLKENGPSHPKPEFLAPPHEPDPPEHIEGDGHEPPKPPPFDIRNHPCAYMVEAPKPQRKDYHRAPPLTRPGQGNAMPPEEGRFSMSERDGLRREYSTQERRAGKPRLTTYGVKMD